MKSPWSEGLPETRFAPLRRDVQVDVAIVGGGIAGVTTAALLKKAGRTVALIEAQQIGGGETGRTTAHLTAVPDLRYRALKSRFGPAGMQRVAESGMAAIEAIAQNAHELGLACDFVRVPAYLYSDDSGDQALLEEEAEAAREAGLDAAFTWELPLPSSRGCAVRYEQQARFHPMKYLVPLASSVAGNGSYVFEQTHVTAVHEGSPCAVETDSGTISSHDVVVATDSPVCNRVFLHTKLAAYRTYVIAGWVDRPLPGLFWDVQDPYHFIRTHPMGAAHLLIVGGQDHKVGDREDTEGTWSELEDWTRQRFGIQEISHRWSGQVLEPVDGLPYIGRNSFSQHLYVATGFSGTGMTFGTLAGMILRDLIEGRPNPWAALYSATRIRPAASAKRYLEENVDFPKHLAQDRLRKVGTVAEIPPGEGRIAQWGARRAAVYKDEAGTLHAVSPVCTHLGCYVHFNSAEKSWDCPCHGSRFDVAGKVLHGPAVAPLEALGEDGEDKKSPPPG